MYIYWNIFSLYINFILYVHNVNLHIHIYKAGYVFFRVKKNLFLLELEDR